MDIKNFIKERIEKNQEQFTNKELRKIRKNQKLINKIYLLGGMDVTNSILGGTN